MNIIIAGAGRVGYRLAQTLSIKHNVTIIDQNRDALGRLYESIDVLPIVGNIEDPDTFKALDGHYDIFIAVTDNDEANILSTLIADDEIDVDKKIIRLRNPYFAKSSIASKLGIDEAVFPFRLAASAIGDLLDFPKANNIKKFIFTPFKLISVRVDEPLLHTTEEIEGSTIVVAGIERDKRFFIPEGDVRLEQNDLIYLFGDEDAIRDVCHKINKNDPGSITKVAIFGAKLLGIEVAKAFSDRKVQIKLIETDPELCKKASEILQDRVTIINSKYIEHEVYEEENIRLADMVIATSSEDEENIIECLEAKEFGVKKTVAVNNNIEFYNLMHKLGIVAVRGPKASAYYAILEKIGSSNIISERHYCGGRGTIFMRKVFEDSLLIGKAVKPLKLDECTTFIIREGAIRPFREKTTLHKEDVIVVFLKTYQEEQVKKWIYNL